MKIHPKSKSILLASCGLAALPLGLNAATVVWNGAGDGTTYEDGANWGGTAPTDDLTTDIAQLTGSTVTLSADRSVNGLDLNAASTLTGTGTRLTLGANGLSGATDLTLDSAIIRTGSGTFTGNVTLNAGTVEVTSDAAGVLGAGTITLDNGGKIAGQGSHINMTGVTSIVIEAGGGTLSNAHTRAVYGLDSTIISGAGLLTLDGDDSVSYSGNSRIQLDGTGNTHTGGTLITNKANVQVSGDGSFGDITGKVTIDDARLVTTNAIAFDAAREFEISANGARISLNSKSSTINGVLSGSGALTFDGQTRDDDGVSPSGTIILNGANTLTSDVFIDGVAVRYTSAGQLGSGEVTLDNGGELYGANHIDMSGNSSIVLGPGGGTIRHRHARNVTGLGSVVISGSGALTLAGESDSGSIRMQGTNTYTGGTIFDNGGYALVSSNAALGDTTGPITFSGGIFQNNNSNVELGTRAISVDADGGTFVSGWTSKRIVAEGVISGVGKFVIGNDSSVVRFGGVNTYSGGTDIYGTLWTKTGSLGTGLVTLNNEDGSRGHLKNWDGAVTHTNDIAIDDTNGGRLSAGWSADLTLTGIVSGAGQLQVEGDSGTVILAGAANTFTGDINLLDTNSRLKVASLGTTGTYSGAVSGAGIFDYAFATTPILDGVYTHTGGTAISDVTVDVTDFPTLNCFNGDQVILLSSSGTLDLQGTVVTNSFLNPEGTFLNNGAAVDYSSNTFTSNGGSFTIDGTGDVTLGEITRTAGNPLIIKTGASTLNLTGTTDNVAGQVQVDAGTVVLAKDSSSSVHAVGGLLTVNGGTAKIGGTGGDQIYNGSTVTMNGGTFDIDGNTEHFKFLNIYGGDIIDTAGGGELLIHTFSGDPFVDAQSGTVSAAITGNTALTKSTAGTVTLSGAVSYQGDTTVNGGILSLKSANTDNESSAVALITGGVLNLDFVGTDTVGTLFIDGVQQPAGVYGSGDTALITGTGTLTVVTDPPAGFAGWITGTFTNGTIPVDQQGENDDPDGDGIANLIEYAIDGEDPTVPNATISTFVDGLLSFTKNTEATGLTYAIEESTDLGLTDDWTEVPAGINYVNDANTISYDMPMTAPENFIRLNVTN